MSHPDPDLAARGRVTDVLERLSRTNVQVLVVSLPDAARLAARDVARAAAMGAGRSALLDDATSTARDLALRAFAGAGFSGTWAASEMAVSVASARDRVATASAFEDAAAAAVVEDLVESDILGVLRGTLDELERMKDIPPPGSLANFASSASTAGRSPLQAALIPTMIVAFALLGFAIGSVFGIALMVLAIARVAALRRGRVDRGPGRA